MRNILIIISFNLFMQINLTFASTSKYYYSIANYTGQFITYEIISINLETGAKKLEISAEDDIGLPFILDDHSKIFFKCKSNICVYDHQTSTVNRLLHLGKIDELGNVCLNPSINEVYLEFIKEDARVISREYHERERTYISINKNSYSIKDTITVFAIINTIIARDGEVEYELRDFSNGLYFKIWPIKKIIIEGEDEIDIEGYENINPKYEPYLIDSKNGYAFIGYLPENDTLWHLVLCDPEIRSALCEIVLPGGIPPFAKALTPTGDMVFQDGGDIYIFDKQTAQIKQRYEFQTSDNPDAESKIFMLDDSLYFFPEDPSKSEATHIDYIGHADLNETQSSGSLIDMMIDDVEEAEQNGWIDNKGIYNSLTKKLEHAQKQLEKNKTKQAVNQLNAFLNELEAQQGKHVNEEAYNLFKFNAVCLIQRLEEY